MKKAIFRKRILTALGEIEKIPGRAGEALSALQDPESDIKELSRIIEYDAGLTATILKMVNSAAFGTQDRISSIKDAIVRMGRKEVFIIAVSSLAKNVSNKPVSGYDLQSGELWCHLTFVGVCSEVLPGVLGIPAPNSLLAAGLMHDIGKVVLGDFLEIDATEIFKLSSEEKLSFEEAEEEMLGFNHAEIGAMLLEKWNVPDDIVRAVRYHHTPDEIEGGDSITDIVHVADTLGMMSGIGSGSDGVAYRPSPQAYERLGLSFDKCEEAMCLAAVKMEELSDIVE
ncbi:MAG: HDOD domain-containing protein [Planctomycetota bacterium]|jgi:putative nucleotidyltransferase with HDIG domain